MYGVLGYSMLIVSGIAVDVAWDSYGIAGLRATLPYAVPLGMSGIFVALVLPSFAVGRASGKANLETPSLKRRRRPF